MGKTSISWIVFLSVEQPESSVISIVDPVNGVSLICREAYQIALVLFHDVLDLLVQAWDVVDVGHFTVWSMSSNGTCCRWIHASKLAICLYIRIVDVHFVRTTQ